MLIDRNGLPAADVWTYRGTHEPGTTSTGSKDVLPLDAWLAANGQGVAPAGIRVQGHDDPERIAALLPQLELVVIEFPKSRDGRGFTLAKFLREKWHFEGGIRAAGPLLPDQLAMLWACGFDSLLSPPDVPTARWHEAALAAQARATRPRTLLERLTA
ncbi:DUF934 domain-containing protein [Pandoraea apista]|uniref:Oxidoreductase n=1 Tax=Pandoraea apista TaxID=93218 RepID=A0A5E5P5B1_9BURK|nr:DUF934 domain-containing protein [Pandoraea apista]AJF00256.1 hypothetical protein SG18_22565 [Pandoraea apista]AKH74421.1 hypothetical protein XM39_22745 [Pandoraea apista]AKI62971.1 hypothetical protein AA956_16070 [Pandoraea apista]ALS64641.1 hypothetical protein AT395_06285 [Pandoraea apista]AVF41224.1 DUF934 domain-containing protein [Pandoraea apista]